MPDRVSTRIALAFAAVGLVAALAVGAGTFVALRDLHRDATISALGDVAQPVAARVRAAGAVAELRRELNAIQPSLRAEMGVYAIVGARVVTADAAPGGIDVGSIAVDPAQKVGEVEGGDLRAADGSRVLYAVTVVRPAGGVADPVAIVLTTPDRSGSLALRDLLRVLPIVFLVTALIALPIALALSRSITRPLHRLAAATAALPDAPIEPVPSEGPREVRDLTDRFNATTSELERVRAEERELLANVRHDLRTPLTVVSGFAEALRDGTATGDQVARAGDAIAQESARMERLVDDLRSIDEIRAGRVALRPEALDPARLAADAAARFAHAAASVGADLRADADQGLELIGDRGAVERILGNLVANALASVRAGGHVLVEARRSGESGVAFRVSDDGTGFPPGSLERVFDRFYRADPARTGSGSGLGLAIVRALAAAHGGTATAENLAPTGARVTVILPSIPTPPPGDRRR
jgi:signal transduction histidine kinase